MRFAPAAARNAAAILERLRAELRDGERVLELGAGTGQHACAFGRALPSIDWLPSEHPGQLDDLRERVASEGTPNVRAPHPLDILALPWNPPSSIDVCYAANVLHMLSEHGAECVLRGAAGILPPGGRLILYGPFAIDGEHTGPGNRAFDTALRADGTGRGVRDLARLDESGRACGFEPSRRTVMPSDNRLVVWERRRDAVGHEALRAVPADAGAVPDDGLER